MRIEHAVAAVKNLARYRVNSRNKTFWDNEKGPFVCQSFIPMCTKRQDRHLYVVMGTKNKLGGVRGIDVNRLRSTQKCLKIKSLMWQVKNVEAMQRTFGNLKTDLDIRGVNLPIVAWVDGVPIIWNGNHRVTACILRGRKRIMVRMFKLRRGYSIVDKRKRKPRGR